MRYEDAVRKWFAQTYAEHNGSKHKPDPENIYYIHFDQRIEKGCRTCNWGAGTYLSVSAQVDGKRLTIDLETVEFGTLLQEILEAAEDDD